MVVALSFLRHGVSRSGLPCVLVELALRRLVKKALYLSSTQKCVVAFQEREDFDAIKLLLEKLP